MCCSDLQIRSQVVRGQRLRWEESPNTGQRVYLGMKKGQGPGGREGGPCSAALILKEGRKDLKQIGW